MSSNPSRRLDRLERDLTGDTGEPPELPTCVVQLTPDDLDQGAATPESHGLVVAEIGGREYTVDQAGTVYQHAPIFCLMPDDLDETPDGGGGFFRARGRSGGGS